MGRVIKPEGKICLSFDYGRFKGKPLTGETHEAILFDDFEELIIGPSGCKPVGSLYQDADEPWVLRPRFWNCPVFQYYPNCSYLTKKTFYKKMPYSYYTLFLEKPA